MKVENKIIFYGILFTIGLIAFISEIFILEIDGIIGFLMTLISFYIMIGSIIKLCKLSPKFKNVIKSIINILFNIW